MNFLKKKISIIWIIITAIGWLMTFLFGGTGVFWEWRRSPLVSLEIGRGLAELYQKKAAALEDVLRVEKAGNSSVWKAKTDYLNALEKSIAELEGRPPVRYGMQAPTNVHIE